MKRDLVVPPDEFTYRNLWIVQVGFPLSINFLGVWWMGSIEDREELPSHPRLGRTPCQLTSVSIAMWTIVHASSSPLPSSL